MADIADDNRLLNDWHQRMAVGIKLSNDGDLPKAEQIFRDILQLTPPQPILATAHHNLGICLLHQGRSNEAKDSLVEAIRLEPTYAQAHRSLGGLLHAEEDEDGAEFHLRKALSLNKSDAEALNNLGAVLNARRKYSEAIILLRQAIRLQPALVDAYNNLGISFTGIGALRTARKWLEKALDLDPHNAAAHANLGNVYKEAKRTSEALACYEIALSISPNTVTTRWNRSLALLQAGNFEEGWKEYEWRWRRRSTPPRKLLFPHWQGEELQGKSILLHAEQGLGDTIQFIRYASVLKHQGANVVFECPQPLVELLRGCHGVDVLVPEGANLPEVDFHSPLMSLPRLCGTTLATIPAPIPYIEVDPAKVSRWREAIFHVVIPRAVRVGIAWQGNPNHPWDSFRSVPLREWQPLLHTPGVQFFSLQTGPGVEQLDAIKNERLVNPLELILQPADMADLAALIQNMDVILSVDTATAHLAGALRAQTWILVAAISDWRWLQDRDDTPWYPSVRLFRQRSLRNWSQLFARVKAELTAFATSRRLSAATLTQGVMQ